MTNEKKQLIIYQATCSVYTHLLHLKSPTTLQVQNIQKHAEILGSKVTNHRVKKFQCESYTLNSQEKA